MAYALDTGVALATHSVSGMPFLLRLLILLTVLLKQFAILKQIVLEVLVADCIIFSAIAQLILLGLLQVFEELDGLLGGGANRLVLVHLAAVQLGQYGVDMDNYLLLKVRTD